ncbi:hypothetical protein EG329_010076 [Mollisiaceae sp. DMI_Dod_QoI]|nr:hypothetical protein EG329_010076 [Helotiales sp. DMI_Dod_QoI]
MKGKRERGKSVDSDDNPLLDKLDAHLMMHMSGNSSGNEMASQPPPHSQLEGEGEGEGKVERDDGGSAGVKKGQKGKQQKKKKQVEMVGAGGVGEGVDGSQVLAKKPKKTSKQKMKEKRQRREQERIEGKKREAAINALIASGHDGRKGMVDGVANPDAIKVPQALSAKAEGRKRKEEKMERLRALAATAATDSQAEVGPRARYHPALVKAGIGQDMAGLAVANQGGGRKKKKTKVEKRREKQAAQAAAGGVPVVVDEFGFWNPHNAPKTGATEHQEQKTDNMTDKPAGWDKFSKTLRGEAPLAKDQGSKKRKRAASNTDGEPSQQLSAFEHMVDEPQDESTEPPRKKSKKHKHDPTISQPQGNTIVATEDGHMSHREIINKIKESKGKTISKKRQRKLAQQAEHSTQSIQESALLLHHVPEYVSKEEALRRTVTRNRTPSNPSQIAAPPERFQSLSPPSPDPSTSNASDDLDNIVTAHQTPSKSTFPPLAKENPINPSPTIHTQLPLRARSTSVSTPRAKKGSEKLNNRFRDPKTPEIEDAAQSLIAAVDSIKIVVSSNRFKALFSPSPAERTPRETSISPVKRSKEEGKLHDVATTNGNMVSADWEQKSGKVRARVATGDREDDAEIMENIAFSSSYVAEKGTIHISHTAFSTLYLSSGEKVVLGSNPDEGGKWKLRICSVAEGSVRVLLGGEKDGEEVTGFEIGKGGMWRVREGERCEVEAVEGDGNGKVGGGRIVAMVFIVGVE